MNKNVYLDKIRLSNLRRIGPNFELDFGPGATVILAPNGTGKSTIFQAIELALTRQVQLLAEAPLNILVRENCDKASAELIFDNGISCKAEYLSNDWSISPHSEVLFPNMLGEDLPYALRLTHLLDQADGKWIIRLDPTTAGDHVNRLSLAKDANKANTALLSAKKQGNKWVAEVEASLADVRNSFRNWNILNERLEKVSPKDSTTFISNSEGNGRILQFLRRLGIEAIPSADDFQSLRSNWAIVNGHWDQMFALLDMKLGDLKKILARLPQFLIQMKLVEIQNTELAKLTAERNTLESQIAAQKLVFANIQQALAESIERSQGLKEVELKLQDLSLAFKEERYLNAELEILNQSLVALQAEIHISQENLELAKENQRKNETIATFQIDLSNKEATIKELGQLLTNVEIELSTLEENESETIRFQNNILKIEQEKRETFSSSYRKLEKEKDELVERISSLAALEETLQRAVQDIASNLPEGQNDCPVCGSEFEHGGLKEAIINTINKSNSGLARLQSELEVKKEQLADQKRILGEQEIKLEETRKNSIESSASFEKKREELLEKISRAANGRHTVTEARQYLEHLDIEIKNIGDELNNLLVSRPEKLTIIELEKIKNTYATYKEKEAELQQSIYKVESQRNVVFARKESLEKRLETTEVPSDISKSLLDALSLQQSLQSQSNIENSKIESLMIDIGLKRGEIDSKSSEIEKLNSLIEDFKLQWNKINLGGSPSEDQCTLEIASITNKISDLQKVKKEIDQLDIELRKVESASEYLTIIREMNIILNGKSATEYQEELSSELRRLESLDKFVKQRNATLNAFSNILPDKIKLAEEHVQISSPLRKSLLKRLVLDPRFQTTELSSGSYYRRNRFLSRVDLGKNLVDVKHIASEAQLTDIQLSMVLANAAMLHWSPWRALLLDDPTQHHDLIHVSGVFDVLRDYIIDLGFQVLFATHDPVHANFFVRKLQNDGILVKQYNLYGTEDGVKAIQHI